MQNNLIEKINFTCFADSSDLMIWISDDTNTLIWCNKAWSLFTEKKENESYELKRLKCIHKENLDDYYKLINYHFEKKTPFIINYRLKHHSGEYRWIQDSGFPLFNHDNEFCGFGGICSDITEKIQANEKVQEIIDATSDGFWDLDLTTNREYMSPRFWEMFGYDYLEMKPNPEEWQKIMLPEDLAKTMENFGAHIASKGLVPLNIEARFYHKSGHIVWVLCRGKVVKWSEEGAPLRAVGTHTDITELKKTQNFLIDNAKLMEMGELAAGIAHEINNPLTVISSRSEMLAKKIIKNDIDFEKTKNDLDKIFSMSKRIAKIVNNLKLLSRNSKEDKMSLISLDELLNQSVDLCSDRFKFGDVKLILDIESAKNIYVDGLADQFSQVFINLIVNAHDAANSCDEKWVKIQCKIIESRVSIIVMDSGKGIPQFVQEKMFNPFFTTKEVGKGTGLGLSISKKIIEHHFGHLSYDPNTIQTSFVVNLPIRNSI